MEFRVLAENYADPQSRRQSADSHEWWPGETAHLAVDGSPATLCAEPVRRLIPVDNVRHDTGGDVPWCWTCQSTAQ
jgi:hypothetical protein